MANADRSTICCKCSYSKILDNVTLFYETIRKISVCSSNLILRRNGWAEFVQYRNDGIIIQWIYDNEWVCNVQGTPISGYSNILSMQISHLDRLNTGEDSIIAIQLAYWHNGTRHTDISIYSLDRQRCIWNVRSKLNSFSGSGHFMSFTRSPHPELKNMSRDSCIFPIYLLITAGTQMDEDDAVGLYKSMDDGYSWIKLPWQLPAEAMYSSRPVTIHFCDQTKLLHITTHEGYQGVMTLKQPSMYSSLLGCRSPISDASGCDEDSISDIDVSNVSLHHEEYSTYKEETVTLLADLLRLVQIYRGASHLDIAIHDIIATRVNQFVIYNCLYNIEAKIGRTKLSKMSRKVLRLLEMRANYEIGKICNRARVPGKIWPPFAEKDCTTPSEMNTPVKMVPLELTPVRKPSENELEKNRKDGDQNEVKEFKAKDSPQISMSSPTTSPKTYSSSPPAGRCLSHSPNSLHDSPGCIRSFFFQRPKVNLLDEVWTEAVELPEAKPPADKMKSKRPIVRRSDTYMYINSFILATIEFFSDLEKSLTDRIGFGEEVIVTLYNQLNKDKLG